MSTFLVTLTSIVQYLAKAREAKQKLDEAKEEMKRAAEELCSNWQGDAAAAFAQEQGVLYSYCSQLGDVGSEYMDVLERVSKIYEEAEQAVTTAIKG